MTILRGNRSSKLYFRNQFIRQKLISFKYLQLAIAFHLKSLKTYQVIGFNMNQCTSMLGLILNLFETSNWTGSRPTPISSILSNNIKIQNLTNQPLQTVMIATLLGVELSFRISLMQLEMMWQDSLIWSGCEFGFGYSCLEEPYSTEYIVGCCNYHLEWFCCIDPIRHTQRMTLLKTRKMSNDNIENLLPWQHLTSQCGKLHTIEIETILMEISIV